MSALPFGTKLDWIFVQVSESVPVRMKRHSIVTVSDFRSPILQRFKFLIHLKMQNWTIVILLFVYVRPELNLEVAIIAIEQEEANHFVMVQSWKRSTGGS